MRPVPGEIIRVKKVRADGTVLFDYGEFTVGKVEGGSIELLLSPDGPRYGKAPLDFLYK